MPTLDWIGKSAVIKHHLDVPYHLIRCERDESVGAVGDGNLLVEGDNLLALKALLPYYVGRVKCVFIDPPYNTGNEDWIYNDNLNAPEMKRWLGRVVGRDDLTRHDKWLCMIYPRLTLLRELLRFDGSLWITLDDTEVHHARLVLDEIFGASNFIANVIWEKADSPRMDAVFFSTRHDHILVYAKDRNFWRPNRLIPSTETASHYDKVDQNGRAYYLKPLRAMGGQGDSRTARPNLYYPLVAPDGTQVFPKKKNGMDGAWRWNAEKVASENDRIEWIRGRNGWSPYFRVYGDSNAGRPPETIWTHGEVGSNRTSKAEINDLFADSFSFNTPKPTKLLRRILQIATEKDSIVVDSFAGSGTTGQAILKLNKEDQGNRRFVLVELEQKITRDITAERLRRVINGNHDGEGLGGGFRYCTLGEPLFDERGQIREAVKFNDLAHHIFFTETGEPLPKRTNGRTPLIGKSNQIAYYLLWDKAGKSILDNVALRDLPAHDGLKVVYADSSRLTSARLKQANVIFKQIPYAVKIS